MEKLERFLVEVRRPARPWSDLDADLERARMAAARLTSEGRPVQLLRSVYVPDDGSCVFLYEGRSVVDVMSAAEALGLEVERVVETIHLEV
jgi:hypothetical protein